MAGDKGRGGGSKENDSAGNVHWVTDTVESSNTLDDVGAKGWVGKSGGGARGGDKSGRDGVHRNVVLAPFNGEALGEMRDGMRGVLQGCRSRGLKRRPLLQTSSPLKPKNQLGHSHRGWYSERGHFRMAVSSVLVCQFSVTLLALAGVRPEARVTAEPFAT